MLRRLFFDYLGRGDYQLPIWPHGSAFREGVKIWRNQWFSAVFSQHLYSETWKWTICTWNWEIKCVHLSRRREKKRNMLFLFTSLENRGNWAKLTFAKTCGTVSKDKGKNWRIADRRVPSNDPRNNCETYSYKVTNFMCHQIVWNIFWEILAP